MNPKIVLMDSETEKMGVPRLLEGYAQVVKAEGLSHEDLALHLGEADAIITVFGKVRAQEFEIAKKLKIVAVAAAGYDCVDVGVASGKRIPVTRAGTATVEGVAEHAIGLMISLSKRIDVAAQEVRVGNWAYRNTQEAFGSQLFAKTVGVVGFGKVGRAFAKKAIGLGMRVLAVDPYVPSDVIKQSGCDPSDFEYILRNSDYICLTGALTKETFHMIGEREMTAMKPHSYLVNIARGGMIDEVALAEALKHGKIAGAGLDVLEKEPSADSPLFHLKNCIITPHIAGLTVERYRSCGEVAVEEVKRVLGGGKPSAENTINSTVL